MHAKIGNINLIVGDVQRSKDFYTQVFGFTERTDQSAPPHFMVLDAGGVTLIFQTRKLWA